MRRNEITRLDAAHEWVREFNAIQKEMLKPFMDNEKIAST